MIEAMKQALEALEQVTKELLAVRDELAERGARPTTNVFHQRLWDSSFSAYTDHAIPAAQSLRQVIAKLESQEPVAWDLADKVRQDLDRKSCPDAFMRIAVESIVKHHPPQRTWVGLTDEEVKQLCLAVGTEPMEVRLIEARLKEKNSL